jgi:alkylation response protein AidB-like acyl-CoA dehydrogenase
MDAGLNDDEAMLVETVRRFVDKEVKPTVREWEHANEYPEAWIEQMKRIGIYAQQRESFGQPIWKHQAVGNYLADMATKLTAAPQLTRYAAERYDSGERCDMEAGMAKLFASEVAMEIALSAVRIHGGYGYSTEYDVERYFRDAPLMIVGEGTNEIQRNVIAGQLVSRGGI